MIKERTNLHRNFVTEEIKFSREVCLLNRFDSANIFTRFVDTFKDFTCCNERQA